jgi:hypothetical protein
MLICWIDSSRIDIMEVFNSKDATAASKTIASAKMPADQGHVQDQRTRFMQVFKLIRQKFNTV